MRGMPVIKHNGHLCDTYIISKHSACFLPRSSFPAQAQYCAQEPLELMHGDLFGLVMPATPGGRLFFLLLVDDATRFMWVSLLTTKLATTDAIKRIQAEAEKTCGRKLRVLRIDNDWEFTATEFTDYCADDGITRHYSAPYSPQQNGIVERRNQTVVGMARALLKQRGMPVKFWGEAVVTAVHLLNRSPTKSL